MRGWTSIIAGGVLLGLAFWAVAKDGVGTTALMFGAGALFLFVRGWQGLGVTEAGDVTAPMEFIANPAGAIADAVVDQLGELLAERPKEKREGKPAFDPDTAVARYLENRPQSQPDPSGPPPTTRGFGRKGL